MHPLNSIFTGEMSDEEKQPSFSHCHQTPPDASFTDIFHFLSSQMLSYSIFFALKLTQLEHVDCREGKDELKATAHTLFKDLSQSIQKDTFPLPLTTTR